MAEQRGPEQEITPTESTPEGAIDGVAANASAAATSSETPAPPVAAGSTPDPAPSHRCPWCSALTPLGATHCPSCGASLAERESLDGMPIPGVTEIDPEVLRRHELTHKVMSGPAAKIAALSPTVSFGLAVASTLSGEMDRRSRPKVTPAPIGVPSAEALQAAARLDREGAGAAEPPSAPGQMPPGQMPPGQMPPGQMPPGQMPPGPTEAPPLPAAAPPPDDVPAWAPAWARAQEQAASAAAAAQAAAAAARGPSPAGASNPSTQPWSDAHWAADEPEPLDAPSEAIEQERD
jgi:hypothetical protein